MACLVDYAVSRVYRCGRAINKAKDAPSMRNRDAPLARPGDIAAALALLTRLPAPEAPRHGGVTAWAWPLAGFAVGVLAWAAAWLAGAVGLPAGVAAGLALVVLVMTTGALHEDGLADSADGLWGGWDGARRLEIMKDSRIGSYGVIALVLSLGMRWVALAGLIAAGQALALVAAAMASRAAMAGVMTLLRPARDDGLSRKTGQPSTDTAALGATIALLAVSLLLGLGAGLLAALAACLAAAGVAAVAKAKIGGQTGDILGAVQQVSEIAVLLAMLALV